MTSMTRIEPLSIWWADVKLEMVADGEFYISKESFERLVLIIDNKAYLVFKITPRLGREGYIIRDLSAAGLPKESVVRTDVLVPVSVSDLRYQVRTTHSDGYAEATSEYMDLDGAIRVFIDMVNINRIGMESNRKLGECDDSDA